MLKIVYINYLDNIYMNILGEQQTSSSPLQLQMIRKKKKKGVKKQTWNSDTHHQSQVCLSTFECGTETMITG
jgi:hypothetical protein